MATEIKVELIARVRAKDDNGKLTEGKFFLAMDRLNARNKLGGALPQSSCELSLGQFLAPSALVRIEGKIQRAVKEAIEKEAESL